MKQFNLWGDILVFSNVGLCLIGYAQGWITTNTLQRIFLIIIFLSCIRGAMALCTTCSVSNSKTQKPLTSYKYDDVWFMISGHTLWTVCATYLIMTSQAPSSLKGISVLLSIVVGFIQASTHEHHTVDIVLTLVLVILAIKAFAI
jgi:hypothetical protein